MFYPKIAGIYGEQCFCRTCTDVILPSPSYSDSEYSYGYFYRVSAENPRQKYDSGDYKISTAGRLFAPVKTVKASLGESSSYIKVTWSAPDEGADGGYYVYRSTKADSGFRRITDTAVIDTLYVDEGDDTVKVGLYYYYKVLSLNSLGQVANYSAVATGWGALTYDQYMREYNKTVKRSQDQGYIKFTD